MEKPGLEPPTPAFPNKGLIEACPAPCHRGAWCLAGGQEPSMGGGHGGC